MCPPYKNALRYNTLVTFAAKPIRLVYEPISVWRFDWIDTSSKSSARKKIERPKLSDVGSW